MTDVRVRGLDESIVHELKAQARRHGKTLQDALKELLTEAALRPRKELAGRLQALRDAIRDEHGELPDSTAIIREQRDQWG